MQTEILYPRLRETKEENVGGYAKKFINAFDGKIWRKEAS